VNPSEAHRLLITGANGFVGRALTERLRHDARFEMVRAVRSEGERTNERTVARPSEEPRATTAEAHTVAVGDISGNTDWSTALRGIQTVVHLAARVHVMRETASNPDAAFHEINVEGTLALARQAAQSGVRRFVFLSSIKVNGEAGDFTEQDTPQPTDAYGRSKHAAEVALRALAEQTGLQVVIVRPPLVYGPGVKANFRMLLDLVSRGMPLPLGGVQNKRSFVAVQNLADFILHCAQHQKAAGETFLISDDDDLSTPELIRRMARALGRPARLVPVPVWMLKFAAAATGQRGVAERLLGSLQLDITKARTALGWSPPLTVDQALRTVVAK